MARDNPQKTGMLMAEVFGVAIVFHECLDCGAEEDMPCVDSRGRTRKAGPHRSRSFTVGGRRREEQYQGR